MRRNPLFPFALATRMPVRAAVLACLIVSAAAPLAARTIVTEYTYNADGALSAVTRQVDDDAPETTYLTWDNFVPDQADPSIGAVSPGTGALAAIGPAPGAAAATETFSFDARDRLLSYDGPAGSEGYDYHAVGTMASSSVGGDQLRFFYDHDSIARVTNIHQDGTDTWAAYTGAVTYFDDGGEEVLLDPRGKDFACSYDPADEVLESYVYEAYGASPYIAPPAGTYDLQENPFRYAGEYRDPIWGGYYLRARWYHPEYQVFVSRDDVENLNRYGYTSGNPVMRIDPTGMKFQYMHDVGNPLGGFLKTINRGVGGHIVRLLFAPLLGPLQIVANPGAFWHAVKTNQDGIDVFLALSIATQAIGGTIAAGTTISITKVLVAQAVAELALGTAQSAVAAAGRGSRHFNWNTFEQGVELSVSAAAWGLLPTAGIRSLARPGVGAVGRIDVAPEESSLGSSLSIRRSRSFDSEPTERLTSFHDDLLSSSSDDDNAFERITKEVEENVKEGIAARRRLRREAKGDTSRRLSVGKIAFEANRKQLSIAVSKAPGFLDDPIDDEELSESSVRNQAHLHAGAIIEELQ